MATVIKKFEIKASKSVFESLVISDDNISATLEKLEFVRVRDFTNPSESL